MSSNTSKEIKDLEKAHKELGDKIEALKNKKEEIPLLWYVDQPITELGSTYVRNKYRMSREGMRFFDGRGSRSASEGAGDQDMRVTKPVPDYTAENIITWIPNPGRKPYTKHVLLGLLRNGKLVSSRLLNMWRICDRDDAITHYAIITPPVKLKES